MTVPSEPTNLLKETIQENFLHNGLGDGLFNIMSKAWEAKTGKWIVPNNNNKKISKILLCIARGIINGMARNPRSGERVFPIPAPDKELMSKTHKGHLQCSDKPTITCPLPRASLGAAQPILTLQSSHKPMADHAYCQSSSSTKKMSSGHWVVLEPWYFSLTFNIPHFSVGLKFMLLAIITIYFLIYIFFILYILYHCSSIDDGKNNQKKNILFEASSIRIYTFSFC